MTSVWEVRTELTAFVYWLERDWPRVHELKESRVQREEKTGADGRFEAWWTVTPVDWNLPLGHVYAETLGDGRVHLEAAQLTVGDVPQFVEPFGWWLKWRFGELAAEIRDAKSRGVESMTVARTGRRPLKCNLWLWEELGRGASREDLRKEYMLQYDLERPEATRSAGRAFTDAMRSWRLRQEAKND